MTQATEANNKTNVFNATEGNDSQPAPTAQAGGNGAESAPKKTFDELVGEGRKFKDAEALAKSKLEADRFIEQLKSEKEEMRKELQRKLDADEILADLKRSVGAGTNQSSPDKNQQPQTSQEDLGRLVDERLTERETQRAYENNVMEADKYITSKLGGKTEAAKFIETKAEELGINKSWLMDVAGRSPKALYSLLGVEPTAASPNDNRGTNASLVHKSTVQQPNRGTSNVNKTKSHYEEIRRTNPALYFSAKVQQEIFVAAKEGRYE